MTIKNIDDQEAVGVILGKESVINTTGKVAKNHNYNCCSGNNYIFNFQSIIKLNK